VGMVLLLFNIFALNKLKKGIGNAPDI